MLKRLKNLPIRLKFAVIIIPLVIIILILDILQVKYQFLDYQDSIRLNEAIIVGVEINHVVHQLQQERNISTGFLSENVDGTRDKMVRQRFKTDSTLKAYYEEIASGSLDDLLKIHSEDIDLLNSYFDRISKLRTSIDQSRITSAEAIDQYSTINNKALDMVIKLIDDTRDKNIAQQVHALIYFLKAKEYGSVERAIGTKAFTTKELDYNDYNQFTSLVANQEAYIDAFQIIANEDFNAYYLKLVEGKEIAEVNRMRRLIFLNNGFDEDPNDWLDVSTTRINLFKRVEDYIAETIQNEVAVIRSTAIRNFVSFLILDVTLGVLAFILMSTIARNLLNNVRKLDDYAKEISTGVLKNKVVVTTKDELGHYANTFNKMVTTIRASQMEIKKQRDKAKFMYHNIYGVSLVVFENIEQGIFLLDKDFKISKFHSKAMKEIFAIDRIAGENFSSFMRPLILPREQEALEMFMRHLFNDDMDEEVVNQLNPIDKVKIHTERDGVVSTKYIRVDFTRIYRKENIQNIMVTVSDETESILLQQHLEEAEKKKQLETERVLSILKIDPSVLRGFLHNSKKMLTSISERYETNSNNDLKDLLEFTFTTVHNLKGNATVIGMELMSNKFHEIEEAITKIQDKQISGKDFLAILYEVDEANRMIAEITEMLNKIVSIYKKFPSENSAASNIMVIEALERGIETISEEVGKTVAFNFNNIDDVVLSDDYVDPFKDLLIQLIRNSIVHGIEAPSVRMTAGKEVQGTIDVELSRDDETMIIKYKDDGKGLDLKAIRERAIEQGIATDSFINKMKDEDAMKLIFETGLTTTDSASKHAGRGRGMNVIKDIIEGQAGSFSINSKENEFFEMTIRFPFVESETEVE
ncbi:MAG: nitrate- and nitrite sensing domain-containing protein [Bacteroidota bacterium]